MLCTVMTEYEAGRPITREARDEGKTTGNNSRRLSSAERKA